MMDDMPAPDADDDKPRRGRPPKDTAASFWVTVRMTKALQMATGKTRKGELREVPLAEARRLVEKEVAAWTDPRPDLK